jgi:hypothetical protein
MTFADFALHLHQPFQLQFTASLTLWLALEGVQASTAATTAQQRAEGPRSCELLFQGPLSPVLPPRTYRMSHLWLGELHLLLVPYQRRQTGMWYKAVCTIA